MSGRTRSLDRKIIDADKNDAAVDEQLSGLRHKIGKVAAKAVLRRRPELRVARLEQNAAYARDIANVLRLDGDHIVGHSDDTARANEFLRVEFVDPPCSV